MTAIDVIHTSSIVVGSGIAGLSAALTAGDGVVISKSSLGQGSSRWAQGGIAAAIGGDDHPTLHAADTERVSGGLGDPALASVVTGAAPDRIRWLVSLGAEFDTDASGHLSLGREAGHGRRRIVHADGDATGAEVMRTLVQATIDRPDIERLDDMLVVDLLRDHERVSGVLALTGDGRWLAVVAPSVVLATGGIGRLYQKTTNPLEVTADGLAMAVRAGVMVRDPEFVQFHPTALDTALDPMPLLTEALRGEGAVLVDHTGYRYMLDVHPDSELAPRDVVARENWRRRRFGPIFLDARMIGGEFPTRFPTVWAIAQRSGLDPRKDLLPVSPAQHYHMGGIATDDTGQTSLPGLYACGEAASTGLHGANRLASNSLLEGLVLGQRVAESIAADAGSSDPPMAAMLPASSLSIDASVGSNREAADVVAAIEELRALMWNNVGLVRDEDGLTMAASELDRLEPRLSKDPTGRNLIDVARLVTDAALRREESRGSHFRSDHPEPIEPSSITLLQPAPAETTSISLARQPSTAWA